MSSPALSYHSYLIRLWQVATNGEGWRVQLTDVDSREDLVFTDLEAFFAYLRETIREIENNEANSPNQNAFP